MFEIKNGRSEKIQSTITFYSDVWLTLVIYRDTQNQNYRSEQIQKTITFYSDVWLNPVIYQNARN